MDRNYNPSSIQRISNWLSSILFLLLSLSFPFLIALAYNEKVPEKTWHIAVGMFLLTITTISRNLFIFFLFLCVAIYMFATYGAYKPTDYFELSKDLSSIPGMFVITSILVASWEKWRHHVIQGAPFLPLSD